MRRLMVPAAPPSSISADEVFATVNCENSSEGNMSSGTSRFALEPSCVEEAIATGALFSSTLVKLVFRPRIATRLPSPLISRLICTPGMRWNDSAMFVSGNLPMSSAKIESVKPTDSFFASVELFRL
jgi:hypothetical protein